MVLQPIVIHWSVWTRKAIQTITPPLVLKSYEEIIAMPRWNSILTELNSHPIEYYNKFNTSWNIYTATSSAVSWKQCIWTSSWWRDWWTSTYRTTVSPYSRLIYFDTSTNTFKVYQS